MNNMFLSQSKDQVAFISHVSLLTVTVYSLTLIISTQCILSLLSSPPSVFSHSYHLHPNLHLYLPVSERQEHEKKKGRENQN